MLVVEYCDKEIKSNDIIAGNGRVLKFYLFILWLYLKNIYLMLMIFFFFLLMHHNVAFNARFLQHYQNLHYRNDQTQSWAISNAI